MSLRAVVSNLSAVVSGTHEEATNSEPRSSLGAACCSPMEEADWTSQVAIAKPGKNRSLSSFMLIISQDCFES